MPKITESINRTIVHVGTLWKRKNKQTWQYRYHDVGRPGNILRLSCKLPRAGWRTYAWSFTKQQVRKSGRLLLINDPKALQTLVAMKKKGELKGYRLFYRGSEVR